jgi:hypothetical protein
MTERTKVELTNVDYSAVEENNTLINTETDIDNLDYLLNSYE